MVVRARNRRRADLIGKERLREGWAGAGEVEGRIKVFSSISPAGEFDFGTDPYDFILRTGGLSMRTYRSNISSIHSQDHPVVYIRFEGIWI